MTAVKVPANAHCTSYYSECPSKCKAWACDDGYVTLVGGTLCVKQLTPECPIGYSLGDGCSCPYGRETTTSSNGKTCYKCCSRPLTGGFKCASCDTVIPERKTCPGGVRGTICACGGNHKMDEQLPHDCF